MSGWKGNNGTYTPAQERVARCLCRMAGFREDTIVMAAEPHPGPKGTIAVKSEQWPAWTLYLPEACAAIDEYKRS